MPIAISDKLTAKTVEKIVADATEIEYNTGDKTVSGNTIADVVSEIKYNTKYVTEEEWDIITGGTGPEEGVEYNIYE